MTQFLVLDDQFITMSIRIFVAALLCGLVGLEREVNKHPAGFRTHLLVGVGACLMMLLSLYGFQPYLNIHDNVRFDPARIPSYVISGIGFLGAGTIMVRGATVKGLTTAASIWIVAGLGLIIGVGMYAPAILTTIVVLLSLIFLQKLESVFFKTSSNESITISVHQHHRSLSDILGVFELYNIKVKNFALKGKEDDFIHYTVDIETANKEDKIRIYEELAKLDMVQKIS